MKNFTFKKLSGEDIPLLHSWLRGTHVLEFWTEKTIKDFESFKKEIESQMASSELDPYIVMLQGKPIGYIQSRFVDEHTFSINQFIGVEEFVNKGLGSLFVKEFTDELLVNKKAKRVITDPSVLNLRAQKAYEKAGFKKTGSLPDEKGGEVVLMEKKVKMKIKKAS